MAAPESVKKANSLISGGGSGAKAPKTLSDYLREANNVIDYLEAMGGYDAVQAAGSRNELVFVYQNLLKELAASGKDANVSLDELQSIGLNLYELPYYTEAMSDTEYPRKILLNRHLANIAADEDEKKKALDAAEKYAKDYAQWKADNLSAKIRGGYEAGRSQEYADRLNAPTKEQLAAGERKIYDAKEFALSQQFKDQETTEAEQAKRQSIAARMGNMPSAESVYSGVTKNLPIGMQRFFNRNADMVLGNFDENLRNQWWNTIFQMNLEKSEEKYEPGAGTTAAAKALGITPGELASVGANSGAPYAVNPNDQYDPENVATARREYESWAGATNQPMKLPEDPLKAHLKKYSFLDEYLKAPRSSRGLYPGRSAPAAVRWSV